MCKDHLSSNHLSTVIMKPESNFSGGIWISQLCGKFVPLDMFCFFFSKDALREEISDGGKLFLPFE